MKITLGTLVAAKPALEKLLTCPSLPAKISFRFSKLVKSVFDELTIHEEQRNKLVQKYGEETEGKSVSPANMPAFIKDMESLNAEELEVNFEPVSIEEMPDNTKLSPFEFYLLGRFIH